MSIYVVKVEYTHEYPFIMIGTTCALYTCKEYRAVADTQKASESYIVYRLKAFLVGKEMKKVQITGYIFQSILLHFYDYIYIPIRSESV